MLLTAQISHISRTSLHDGPGIRTVVYFKGCGLRCLWCHNPETLSAQPDILYAPVKCIHCGKCVESCPEHHIIIGEDMVFSRDGCVKCGKCADICPSGALSVSGNAMTTEEVMAQIRKDAHFYRHSGGGVTLSGGECLLQGDFCQTLLQACKAEGIHCAVESALFVPWDQIEKVLPYCDLFFADFKIADPEKHRIYTGQDNALIYRNLQKLAQSGKVIVRIPLIPGVNDSTEDINGFGAALAPFAEKLLGIEVLRYNCLAKSKYLQAGMDYTDFGDPQSDDALITYCTLLENAISHKAKVYSAL